MKRNVLFFLVLVLRLESFSQATATASISATIIDADELIKEAGYDTRSKLSQTKKIQIVDSMLSAKEKSKTKVRILERAAHMRLENKTYAMATRDPEPLTKEQEWYGQVHLSIFEDIWQIVRFHNKTPHKRKEKLKNKPIWCN